ncbi:MAG TPA: hypothetical protein VLD63_12675 [Anaerolineales bacterium]|nr:hypothetical protein [Anaerolineales bacterium]
MSNTGQKGITYLPDQGVYKITVGWRGKVVTRYVRGRRRTDLPKAVKVRDTLERALGKPRTNEILRSFGVAQGKTWRRRLPKKAKTSKRPKRKKTAKRRR